MPLTAQADAVVQDPMDSQLQVILLQTVVTLVWQNVVVLFWLLCHTNTHQRESKKLCEKRQRSDGLIHSDTGWVQLACPVRPPARNNKHPRRDPDPAVHRQTPEPVNRTTAARPVEPHETGPACVYKSLREFAEREDGYACKVCVKILPQTLLRSRVGCWSRVLIHAW